MALPNSRMMLHQPLGGTQGQASDHTGQSIEVIERDTDRDFFLTAKSAVEYGLVDRIIISGEGIVK